MEALLTVKAYKLVPAAGNRLVADQSLLMALGVFPQDYQMCRTSIKVTMFDPLSTRWRQYRYLLTKVNSFVCSVC